LFYDYGYTLYICGFQTDRKYITKIAKTENLLNFISYFVNHHKKEFLYL